jgi:hypothetical protein
MAISGIQVINVGLQNESTGSDSLYTAFNKTKTNFNTLFNNASPYNTFTANTGIGITANANLGTVNILNTGVTSIIAGTGIAIDSSNGAVTITNTGGNGNGAGVTSVGVVSSTLTVSGTPIVSSGNITVNLPTYANLAGTYTYPTVTVDTYGRVTAIANANSVGTVTSIGVTPGAGIQVTGSPITTSGNINIINTGVTRLNQGSGISLSSSNGNVTISTTPVIAVTSVGISSSTLTVSGSPITTTGTMTVDLPANTVISGRVTANTMVLAGSEDLADAGAANLLLTASYFTTTAAETATLAAGTAGQIKTFMMVGDGGDMVITVTNAGWKSSGTGTMTFDTIGDACTLQYIASKWFCIGNNGVVFA